MLGISSTFSLRFAEQGDAGRLYKAASKRMSVAFAPEEFHFDRAAAMNNPGRHRRARLIATLHAIFLRSLRLINSTLGAEDLDPLEVILSAAVDDGKAIEHVVAAIHGAKNFSAID